MADLTTLESLLEMGFDRNRAERAVASTGNQGIEQAMDWLMEHENDTDIDEPYKPSVLAAPDDDQTGTQDASLGGTAGVASGEGTQVGDADKKAMTEEEKQQQVKSLSQTDPLPVCVRLEELMRLKQAERRERERAEELEKEKQRRKQGQELQQIRNKLHDDDMKKLAELRQREKMEDKMARQRVIEKIARDREERAQKFGGGGTSSTSTSSVQPSPVSPTGQGPPPTKREYDESRIQVRLLDGSTLTAVFKAQEPLAAVHVYVQVNGNTPEGQEFTLLSPYPRHVYTDLDMEKPLKELGLVPSAVLVVTKK
ncbi:UBX domain-containing protein 1 isoform X2 [Syngnathus acus]|uniref:UBX domain-containing protein 1 isoform X2 n=1 Tax=Syngnathus acus TaxID=161584 RepID=UPI0018864A59|nr:UBX domain-containing protein 1 isoform X2 [Syngnathus acus]XP_037117749.1 UBX domain-containing protein 1 isoform X2 [Syngnathus acus]XP_037117750.1 UBX domain-containing protein 1 isoform X2 [Syngnathus acus]XP_037117751.1 UBX domain-containing protein 1 isoform X2 [Syngnathus acus]XP_037117753.1 UBX domain-containing protein 1 isoform X2 [Syngnathus acus]